MLLMFLKLLGFVRKAIAGRRYPGQLAWGIGLGVMLGLVPQGNLVAIALLILVLSLRINHAMTALCGVAASFGAAQLDPYSHKVGLWLHQNETFAQYAQQAWSLPLVPWTDLNNTLVLGSFVIAIGSVLPVVMVSYPVLRWAAPRGRDASDDAAEEQASPPVAQREAKITRIEVHRDPVPAPKGSDTWHGAVGDDGTAPPLHSHSAALQIAAAVPFEPIEQPTDVTPPATRVDASHAQQQMDEALHYLLRQLRESQERNAA